MSSLSLRCIVVFLQILVGMWLSRNPNKRSMSFAQIKVSPLHRFDIATKELVMYSIWCCNSECPRGYRCRLTAIFWSGALQIQFCNFVGSPKIYRKRIYQQTVFNEINEMKIFFIIEVSLNLMRKWVLFAFKNYVFEENQCLVATILCVSFNSKILKNHVIILQQRFSFYKTRSPPTKLAFSAIPWVTVFYILDSTIST